MSGPRIGELFAGYGGLGMGVQAALGGEMAWYSEIDKGALKILTHRFPDVPNIGDITAVDWSTVEPVDILTGGSPCQDLSHAGKRAGMTEGTRSNLWVAMREAIAQLRPRLVIWENVRGAYSAEADSDLGSNPRLLADTRRRDGQPVLRALGRVLGDLSDLGYVGGWHGLRAADIGAPHGRFRVFVVAQNAAGVRGAEGELARVRRESDGHGPSALPDQSDSGSTPILFPTPSVADALGGHERRGGARGDELLLNGVAKSLSLLPTPAVNDMGEGKTPERWDEWTADMQARHGNGNGHGKSLAIEAQRLLPTPTTEPNTGNGHARNLGREAQLLQTPSVADALGGHESRGGARSGELLLNGQAKAMHGARWGDYAAAIARWEHVLGRPAPAPTQTSAKGNPQLSPAFVEWLMGLPAGWVTNVPGITRNEALKALGNGVVPAQAEAAIRWLHRQGCAA
jgi:DNA (cytosine-5)-methyltransferase 1